MIIGQFYQVPAVEVKGWYHFDGVIPIVGPEHEDAATINFPYDHWHIDWRFIAKRFYDYFSEPHWAHVYAFVVQRIDLYDRLIVASEPTLRRMKYKRELPPYPYDRAKWSATLAAQFKCAKLINGTCPHRGIPVSAMKRDGDILTCPGHGLQWNAITGLAHTSNSEPAK